MPASQFIYVVDDDEAVRDSLSLLLEARGYTVRSFAGRRNFSPRRRACVRAA
jgi:FixJ family two-component response regulator